MPQWLASCAGAMRFELCDAPCEAHRDTERSLQLCIAAVRESGVARAAASTCVCGSGAAWREDSRAAQWAMSMNQEFNDPIVCLMFACVAV